MSDDDGPSEIPDVAYRNWADLTPALLLNVFRRISLRDRWAGAMGCCRAWREVVRDPTLFAVVDLEPYFETEETPAGSSACWTPAFGRWVDQVVRSAAGWADGSIREVRVRHCCDCSIGFLAERAPNLQILSIKSSRHITDASMIKVAHGCSMLIELDISYCYEISYKSLEVIGRSCPNLSILKRNLLNWLDPTQHAGIVPQDYLNNMPQDGDREAGTIAKFMPKLKHLEIQFSKLSINGLAMISEGCLDLEFLNLFGCANITSRGIMQASDKLKNLKTLLKPNFYIPRSMFHTERYGHWRLYDERFQTNVFQI